MLSEECLFELKKYEPVLDLFAGNGSNAELMSEYDINVVSTNEYEVVEKYYTIETILFDKALNKYNTHTLFINWPEYDSELPTLSLLSYTKNIFIYLGPLKDGTFLKNEFFNILESFWNIIFQKQIDNRIHFIIYERK